MYLTAIDQRLVLCLDLPLNIRFDLKTYDFTKSTIQFSVTISSSNSHLHETIFKFVQNQLFAGLTCFCIGLIKIKYNLPISDLKTHYVTDIFMVGHQNLAFASDTKKRIKDQMDFLHLQNPPSATRPFVYFKSCSSSKLMLYSTYILIHSQITVCVNDSHFQT